MKINFFEIPFIVKFFIFGFLIWGASILPKSSTEIISSSPKQFNSKTPDSIFTNTSVPVPLFVAPQSKTFSKKNHN